MTSNGSAYLALIARMPSEKTTEELVKSYFLAEYWSFQVLDQHYFEDLWRQFQSHFSRASQLKNRTSLSLKLATFPALLFSVLALELQALDPETNLAKALGIDTVQDCDDLSQSYIDTGQEIIQLFEEQKPTTTSIEYHLTRTSWLKNCGRGNECWQCLGVALRQAQEIDLHQVQDIGTHTAGTKVTQILLQRWELEHQKRLWARIFILDSHMAVALGRPRGIHREDCSTPAPLDCTYPNNPSQTMPISTNHLREPPNSFSPVMFSIALSHKYHDLMSLRASKRDLKDYSSVQNLHDEIESLLVNLPPALRPSFPDTTWDSENWGLRVVRLRLLTTANIFLLSLHRPYVSTHAMSRYAAITAGLQLLQAQQDLFLLVPRAQHRLYAYSFYSVDASTFIVATILRHQIHDLDISTRALQAVQDASLRLGCMKDRSKIAKTGEGVLHQCCAVLEARISSPSGQPTPSTGAQEQSMEFDDILLSRELGTYSPGLATEELLSFLAVPSTLDDNINLINSYHQQT